MKLIVYDWHTVICPTDEEIKEKELCNIGAGPDTCIWLVVSPDGFECTCLNKPHYLVERLEKGLTTAKKDGCDFVNNLDIQEMGFGTHEVSWSKDTV